MHYCWHYTIHGAELAASTQNLLRGYNNIPHNAVYDEQHTKIVLLAFDIEETHPHFGEITSLLPQNTPHSEWNCVSEYATIQFFPVYSDEEYLSAKWLAVRSAFLKVIPENEEALSSPMCPVRVSKHGKPLGRHRITLGSPVIRSSVKWRRNFFAASVIDDCQLFCNEHAHSILLRNEIKGIEFLPVLKKANGQQMEDIYQLSSAFIVPDGAVIGLEWTKPFVCEQCGMQMISIQGDRWRFSILPNCIPEETDYCQTLPMFLGPNLEDPVCGSSIPLVSQRMYRVLRENMLDRSLFFTPIDIVEQ